MSDPVRYSPDVEKPTADEAETIRGLEEQFQTILDTTSKDYGHAVRAVHAKAHGIARGTLTVRDDLPPHLAQGICATPGDHEAILRISTNAGDILPDSIRLPRGLALKILDVAGERLAGSEGDSTQDLVLVNGPAFAAPDAKTFLGNLKMLAKTTDKGEGLKQAASAVLRAAEGALEAVGGESSMLKTMGGAPQVHPLGETYYSQTPFRYGDHIAKWSLAPVSPALTALTGDTINASGRPDALRQAVREVMIEQGGTWELRVQLCTDLNTMPIEDASVVWDEEVSPFFAVATLTVPPQLSWGSEEAAGADDRLAFSPWHGIAAHQPLGGVNRARNAPYRMSAEFRGRFNGCPIREPAVLSELA